MILEKSSLTIALLGDWNKLYIQPEWMAKNVYVEEKIEITVNGQGTDYNVSYRGRDILIAPTQNKILFSALNMDNSTIIDLVQCINRFLQKATTPILSAYGFNCEFYEEHSSRFAEVVDGILDNNAIIANGYEIKATTITRTLVKDEKVLNLESSLEGNKTKLHFNEHYGQPQAIMPNIEIQQIENFILAAQDLVKAFGYDLEEEDNE